MTGKKFHRNPSISSQVTSLWVTVLLVVTSTMDAKQFRVLIYHCFLMKKILCKPKNGLISVTRTLPHRKPNSSAAVRAPKMPNALEGRTRWLHRKTSRKPTKSSWKIAKWSCRRSLTSWRCRKAVFSQFCMNICPCENFFQNGCRAHCHKSLKTMAKLYELGFELLPHPPYSPDLAPSDYWLFAQLKKWLAGRKFHSNNEVITECVGQDKSFYKKGIEMLERRWTDCITLQGKYVDE